MFGFVGQSSKTDNKDIYDSYIKVVPPLKRGAEILIKTLEFFGWSHVAMIGGGLDTNTWDKVDALWKIVEDLLRANFKLTAAVKFDTSDQRLMYQNIKHIATVARGEECIFVIHVCDDIDIWLYYDHIVPPLLFSMCRLFPSVLRSIPVIVVLTNSEDSMALLVEAERQGLMNGEYVFFLLQHFEVSGSVVSRIEHLPIKI